MSPGPHTTSRLILERHTPASSAGVWPTTRTTEHRPPDRRWLLLCALVLSFLSMVILSGDARASKQRYDGPVQASWYYDSGSTACGFHARYGIASRTLPCGTRVALLVGRRRVTATVDDRGPYVYPRVFDLDIAVRERLAYAGPCCVYYRVIT